eukprot:jgi/Botrbrau1/16551/Bobra.176_2s0001.2
MPRDYEQHMGQLLEFERRGYAALGSKNRSESMTPAPSPGLQAPMRYEVVHTEIPNLKVETHANGSFMGSGTLRFLGANGTLLTQMPFAAPLVSRSSLQDKQVLMSFTAASAAAIEFMNATVPTVELFQSRLKSAGVLDLVDEIREVSVDTAGLPGYTSFLLGCSFGVPAKTYAWIVTFKDDPDAVAFFFSPTDFAVSENVVDDICFGPKPLNTTASYPCPPKADWPCLVSQGFQLAFDSVRDQLLPTWRNMSAATGASQPKKIICIGHSLGASMASLCAPFIKGMVPTANVTFFGTGVPMTGNEAFQEFSHASTVQSTNFIHASDIFSAFPSFLAPGYTEMKDPIWLVRTDAFNDSSYVALAQFRPPGIYINFLDHFTGGYVAALESAIANAPT